MKLMILGAAALALAITAPGRATAAKTQSTAHTPARTKCADATWTTATTNICAGHGGVDAKWLAVNKPAAPKGAVDSGSIAANLNSDNVPAAKPRNR